MFYKSFKKRSIFTLQLFCVNGIKLFYNNQHGQKQHGLKQHGQKQHG